MFTISVDFLHGTFRADPDGTANTGCLTYGEWPPAPVRLFAAFVAADGTRGNCRVTDGSEMTWFEQLPPPVICADPDPCHQPVRPRYVVKHEGSASKSIHQEYVGRKGALIRPGVRVAPRCPHVSYSWDMKPPAQATLDALRRRAARIGYLGASDSPVRVRVGTSVPPPIPENFFIPDPRGDVNIPVTKSGDLEILDRIYDKSCKHGVSVSRMQFPALRHEARYRSPRSAQPVGRGEVIAWLRLDMAVSGRRISMVTSLFKEALLSKYQSLHGEPPQILHGHGFKGTGYEIARYLALPDVGFHWSRGRIHGLALWVPPGCDPAVRQQARDAAFEIRRLAGRGMDMSVVLRGAEAEPLATNPQRWLRSSRLWATAFPAIHERRRALDLEEITRWCRHAGLPEPTSFRSARTPLVPGALDLTPVEVNRPGRPKLPYSHLELCFTEPVPGPVVVGAGRQRGFGLCIPVAE